MRNDEKPIQWSKQQQVLSEIIENGPISKRELQTVTGISWGMISSIANQLVEDKYIVPYIRESQGVGRRAEEYDINNNDNYCIGIDFNYSGIVGVVADMKGRVVKQDECIFTVREREQALNHVFEIIDKFFEEFQEKRILGIGVSMQGIVDIYEGVSILISAIKDWENVPLKQILEKRYSVKVFLEHDPNCIMRSERALGCLRKRKVSEAILTTVDHRVGIGMSALVRGQICHGFHGKAGEIGCVPIHITSQGTFEYMEGHVIREGIQRDYQNATGKTITYSEFLEKLGENDTECVRVYEQLCKHIGFAVSTAGNFLNPQVIVLYIVGGDAERMFQIVSDIFERVIYDKTVEIRLSRLGKEAKANGAALIVAENALQTMN